MNHSGSESDERPAGAPSSRQGPWTPSASRSRAARHGPPAGEPLAEGGGTASDALSASDRRAADGRLPGDFAAWYEEHRSVVFRYVRFRVASRETAEDVTSEVFLKALRAFDRYDPDRASPRTWLLRIARNAVTDHLRALRRRGSLHVSLDRVPDLVAEVPSQEERLLREERLQKLLNANRRLRTADQEILSLRYGAGLGNGEIAVALDITQNAVAVRLHRALKRLQQAVADIDSKE